MIGCMILGGLVGFFAIKMWHHRRHGWAGCGPGGHHGWHPGGKSLSGLGDGKHGVSGRSDSA